LTRILGTSGHLYVIPVDLTLDDFDPVTQRIAAVPGVKLAIPLVEGQVLAQGNVTSGSGARFAASEAKTLRKSRLSLKISRKVPLPVSTRARA
jgi:lipoprotein-releasing system permease protein